MAEFFSMGGYAAEVWSAYAIVLGGCGIMAWLSFRNQRRLRDKADHLRAQRREERA